MSIHYDATMEGTLNHPWKTHDKRPTILFSAFQDSHTLCQSGRSEKFRSNFASMCFIIDYFLFYDTAE